MAINPLSIPGYAAPQTLDFTPLAQLGQVYQQGQAQRAKQQALSQLGQSGQADINALIQSGDMSLAQLGLNLQQRQQDQERQARLDSRQVSRDAVDDRFRSASLDLQRRAAAREDDRTPTGFERTDGGVRPIPGGPQDPEYLARVNAVEGKNNFQQIVEQRKQQAQAVGLDPSSPGYQSFVLTGKMPREDAQPLTATDKKAILEADEGVLAARSAVDALNQAKTLSKQAFEGPTAGMRGYAASFLGEGSDLGKAGIATADLENTLTSNALTQLKAIFGGAPTEGERKILLDIQGSARLPDAVRQRIYDRALILADRRLKMNEQRASELRGGNFYKPQGSMQRAPVQQTQGITKEQFNALPSGSVFTAPDGTQRVKP